MVYHEQRRCLSTMVINAPLNHHTLFSSPKLTPKHSHIPFHRPLALFSPFILLIDPTPHISYSSHILLLSVKSPNLSRTDLPQLLMQSHSHPAPPPPAPPARAAPPAPLDPCLPRRVLLCLLVRGMSKGGAQTVVLHVEPGIFQG